MTRGTEHDQRQDVESTLAEQPDEATPEVEAVDVESAGDVGSGDVERAEIDVEPDESDVEPDPGVADPVEGGAKPVEGGAAWLRLLRMGHPRLTNANVLSGALALLLGIGIATQVQLTNSRGLEGLSQADLVRVLDDVSVRASKLDSQVRELEDTRDRLKRGTGSTAELIQQAQKRFDTLGILAGALPTHGPGIRLTISDPDRQVTGPTLLDLIQELRDAGAESIDIGGIRVVASTFVGSQDGELTVDGHPLIRPIVVKAIGSSKTLASAMTIPGGIVETVRQKGASASVTEVDDLEITSIHQPTPLVHAEPAS
jgi:uncharacterized protein YlxW (UPF0749 family)